MSSTTKTTRPDGRVEVGRLAEAPASIVWDVLADGWLYSSWVVGASRVRAVDLTWPAVGSSIHHSFGVWPAVLDDESTVTAVDPGRTLALRAKGWPMGEAQVELTLEPRGPGATLVTIVEDVVKGPGLVVPRVARQPAFAVRNVEALRRLALIAEGRHREALSAG